MGCARRFRALPRHVAVIGCEPVPGERISGLRSLSEGFVPPILHLAALDDRRFVTSDEAIAMSRRLAHEEGVLAGPSSGAVIHACVQIAESLAAGTIVGMIFDGACRYLSSGLASDPEPAQGERTPPSGVRESG